MTEEVTTPAPLPLRDPNVSQNGQGLFQKYELVRVDGKQDPPGTDYFVLKPATDEPSRAAMRAYAAAVMASHPQLATDILDRWDL